MFIYVLCNHKFHSAGFELALSELKAGTLTTWPPPRPICWHPVTKRYQSNKLGNEFVCFLVYRLQIWKKFYSKIMQWDTLKLSQTMKGNITIQIIIGQWLWLSWQSSCFQQRMPRVWIQSMSLFCYTEKTNI